MSTAKAMRRQHELIRADGKREGFVEGVKDALPRGERLQRRRVIEHLKRRWAAATLAAEKLVLVSIRDDIEANRQHEVPLPDGVVE